MTRRLHALLAILLLTAAANAGDWPMWGRDQTRNMVSPEKNPPTDWQVEVKDESGKIVEPARNINWSAQLGRRSMASPVVADGLVWVGTNNAHPRDPQTRGDRAVLMCFRESDGKFLWQYTSPRLKSGQVNDWPYGTLAAPVVEGDHIWFMTNRCETVCFDVGPFRKGQREPRLVWKVDMVADLKVFPKSPHMGVLPHNSVAVHKDLLFVVTGNGTDEAHVDVPAPKAPSLVCFNKNNGKIIWTDNSPGKDILYGQWTTPLVIEIKEKAQVVMGQGDGWLRSFDAETGKLIWKCDLNHKHAESNFRQRGARNFVLATPVFADGQLFIGTGQHPEYFQGLGRLFCIDPTGEGDISPEVETTKGSPKSNPRNRVVWQLGKVLGKEEAEKQKRDVDFGRTVSNCVVQDGLVYTADLEGFLHCIDARTGQKYWAQDLKANIIGSPLWVDGRIYVGTDDGEVWIFQHGKRKQEPKTIDMRERIYGTPVFANGVLYIATDSRLYAIREKK